MVGRLLDKPPQTVMTLAIGVVVLLKLLAGLGLWVDYRATVADREQQFTATSEATRDRLVHEVAQAGRAVGDVGALAVSAPGAGALSGRLLRDFLARHAGLQAAAVLDAQGAEVASAGAAGLPFLTTALRGIAAAAVRDNASGPARTAPRLHARDGQLLIAGPTPDMAEAATPGVFGLLVGPDWLQAVFAPLRLEPQQSVGLRSADDGHVLWSGGGDPVAPEVSRLSRSLPVDDDGMVLTVEQDWHSALAPWRERLLRTISLGFLADICILLGGAALSGTLLRVRQVVLDHTDRMERLVIASERMSRAASVDDIVRQAERVGVSLLGCDRMTLQVYDDAPPPMSEQERSPHVAVVELQDRLGRRLGRLCGWFAPSVPLSAERRLVLDQFSRSIAASLSIARQLAEITAARAESEFVLSSISEGMYVLDHDWTIRYANEAAVAAVGVAASQVLGSVLWELDPSMVASRPHFERAAREDQIVKFTMFHEAIRSHFELRLHPFAGGITVFFRDVTAEREARERRRQDESLESLGLLTRGIVHDVNNMLTVMLGNLEMLMMEAEEASPPRAVEIELARAGLRAGQTAVDFMRRLQVFSRQQHLVPAVVDMRDLLSGLPALLGRRVGAHVELRVQADADLWDALIDRGELESALLNLAINSADAMPSGGQLAISAQNVTVMTADLDQFGVSTPGSYIELSVRDTGSGIPPELLGRVFEPYVTTKPPGQGSGLGLSMVYGFAKQSGGGCSIYSEVGSGTTVTLILPRAAPAAVAARPELPAPAAAEAPGSGPQTILLVEDHDLVRAHTAQLLTSFGYQVVVAADGVAALQLLGDGLRPDLLLTDVILPGGMNGREAAEAATAMLPGLPVLYVSGYNNNVLQENGRLRPGVDLLTKPFSAQVLASRVGRRLGRSPDAVAAAGEDERGAAQMAPSAASR